MVSLSGACGVGFCSPQYKSKRMRVSSPKCAPVVLHLFKKQHGVHCSTQAGITAGCIGTSCLTLCNCTPALKGCSWDYSGLLALWTFDMSSGKSPEGCVAWLNRTGKCQRHVSGGHLPSFHLCCVQTALGKVMLGTELDFFLEKLWHGLRKLSGEKGIWGTQYFCWVLYWNQLSEKRGSGGSLGFHIFRLTFLCFVCSKLQCTDSFAFWNFVSAFTYNFNDLQNINEVFKGRFTNEVWEDSKPRRAPLAWVKFDERYWKMKLDFCINIWRLKFPSVVRGIVVVGYCEL